MSDRDWREAERAWQADPQDRAKYEAAIAARRRAGVPISGPLLEGLIHPARTFESNTTCSVWAISVERKLLPVGRTPGKVEIPAHRAWWMLKHDSGPLPSAEFDRQGVSGLNVGAGMDTAWKRLDLELIEFEHAQAPPLLRLLPACLVRLLLTTSFFTRPDWSHSFPHLEHLTEVWLFDTPVEPITLVGLARLPSLRRLHVLNPTRHLRGQVHEALPHCRLASA